MKRPARFLLAATFAALATPAAWAYTSQKAGDTYVYAPTVLGSRHAVPYVSEPAASSAAGGDTTRSEPLVQALNADASLKGSKITVTPDGDTFYMTGVTVTVDQMQRALQIAATHAGEGKVANAIRPEELVVQVPMPATVTLPNASPST